MPQMQYTINNVMSISGRIKACRNISLLSAKRKQGRPTDTDKEEAFLIVALYLDENDDEQITVGELVLKMKEYYSGEDSYTHKYMKKRITEHFDNNVIITEINGKPNVVLLRSNSAYIPQEFYDIPKQT